ncbi:putative protein CHUP1 [Helianthus debilis subsp. tardiflorus]
MEKRDMSPVILKLGLALAFSLGGMLFTFLTNKRIKDYKSADCKKNQGISPRRLNSEHPSFDPLATDKHNSLSDKDSYLLPEFNDLMKEFDSTTMKTNPKLPTSDANSPSKVNSVVKTDSHEQEIKNLRNMVKVLKERERKLELQLLEYHGLKQQETTVKELQNRLKLNNMEAKLLSLKVESLENDNKRLQSQTADYNKVLTDLESARAKINVLKKKLRSEAAQNKERILDLQQRVEKMQEDERKGSVGIDSEIELKLCRLKDLEEEVNELRKSNFDLQVEKSELTQRLEHVQILAASVLEDQETEKLKKESETLKKQNEELTKEIEQLQADRCSDVEELVYMRWVNACLRYELRNYQPGPSKTMARDLSKTLSPRSEEKAKRLILEYANQELDFDPWSSPQSSSLMDSGQPDHSLSRKSNKFFGKLVKFLRRKDENVVDDHNHRRNHSQCSSSLDTNSYSDYPFGYLTNSSKHSMDSRMSFHRHKRIDSISEGGDVDHSFSGSLSSSDGQKSELVKYAEVLKGSNPKPTTRYRRRSTPFSSF